MNNIYLRAVKDFGPWLVEKGMTKIINRVPVRSGFGLNAGRMFGLKVHDGMDRTNLNFNI